MGHLEQRIQLSAAALPISEDMLVTGELSNATDWVAQTQALGLATTTTLKSSVSTPFPGQSVTLTATVGAPAGVGTLPGGKVTFKDGTRTLGTVTLNVTLGKATATLTTSALTAGSHSLTAVYLGSTQFSTSTGKLSLPVSKAATTTTLTSAVTASKFGQPVTLKATLGVVTPGITKIPAGSVTFKDGTRVLGTAAVKTVSGKLVAEITTSTLAVGAHSFTAVYGGDANFDASTSRILRLTVAKAVTTTTLTSSVSAAYEARPVTFTATVSVSSPSTGTAAGSVRFKEGTKILGTVALRTVGGKSVATLTTSKLALGRHTVTAEFIGGSSLLPSVSRSTSVQIVKTGTPAGTTTVLTSSMPSAGSGTPITFTAAVSALSPGTGLASGTVTFKDGTRVIGTVPLLIVNGKAVATLRKSDLTVGRHTITAVFAGTSRLRTSTSAAVTQVISGSSSSTTISSTPLSGVSGQTFTLKATVTAASGHAGIPTGIVTFKDGATVLGTGTLTNVGGKAVATLVTKKLLAGNHSIVAVYAGSGGLTGSTSTASTVSVRRAVTTITTSSSASSSPKGVPVTLKATVGVVAPGSGIPTGVVTFRDGSTVLGNGTLSVVNGVVVATFTTSSLSVGTHRITATYAGSSSFEASTSTVYSQVITDAGGLFDGSYSGSFSGTVVADGITVQIPGPMLPAPNNAIEASISDGSAFIVLPGLGANGFGSLGQNGQLNVKSTGGSVAGYGINVSFTGTVVRNAAGQVTGSGTWVIVDSPGVTGSGTWTISKVSAPA